MKILFISHENNLGGATRSMLGIIDELLKDEKNEAVVFVPKFNEKTKSGDLIYELKKRNVKYYYKRAYWWMYPLTNKKNKKQHLIDIAKILSTVFTCIKIAPMIKKENVDIIHSNSSVTFVGAFLSKVLNKKHILHIREFGEEDHGITFVMPRNKCIKFMNNNTDMFICISKSIYDKYSVLYDKDKCITIYNGVNLDLKYKNPKNKKDLNYNLLISGRIKESKGQLDAIKALNILIKKGYNKLTLNVAGYADNEYLEKIKEYIKNNNLSNNVIIHNFISNINEFRKDMDIEVVCSKMEAFGRVTVEAMLSSNIVIGANTGGTAELIENCKTGLLYNYGDINDLSKKIEDIITKYEKRKKIVENAYLYARENFTSVKNAEQIINLYNRI